jgi:hypothetical protein
MLERDREIPALIAKPARMESNGVPSAPLIAKALRNRGFVG